MKEYKVMLSVRITLSTAQALDAHTEATGEVKTQVVEDAIKMYLAKGGKK